MDPEAMHTTFHSIATELYIHFKHSFSRVNHILSHKTHLNKFKINVISSIFFDCSSIKLEINNRKKNGKFTNVWKLKNILLNNQWVKEETKSEKNLETNENGNTIY